MSEQTYGERVFRKYITANKLQLDHEPEWPHTLKRPDYRIPHPTGDVVLEIKDIDGNMFGEGSGAFNPYELIRTHIDAARNQLKPFADFRCVIALKAGKHAIVDLETPHIMLGAMYGNYGFTIPFDLYKGAPIRSEMTSTFIRGRGTGRMQYLRRDGTIEARFTRISAILTIHDPETLRSDEPGVTVWENAYACRPLPSDLFRGKMDRWYGVDQYQGQGLTFEGEGISALLKRATRR